MKAFRFINSIRRNNLKMYRHLNRVQVCGKAEVARVLRNNWLPADPGPSGKNT
jgi:hypothetical protein